jgi:transcriptional regulator with XRE-family HTH domain
MSINHIAKRIKKLRKAVGWSQSELARKAGLTPAAICSIERIDNRMPKFETIKKIASALQVGQEMLTNETIIINESEKDKFYREWSILTLLVESDIKIIKNLAERLNDSY